MGDDPIGHQRAHDAHHTCRRLPEAHLAQADVVARQEGLKEEDRRDAADG